MLFEEQTIPYPALQHKIIFQVYGFIKMIFFFFYCLNIAYLDSVSSNKIIEILNCKLFPCLFFWKIQECTYIGIPPCYFFAVCIPETKDWNDLSIVAYGFISCSFDSCLKRIFFNGFVNHFQPVVYRSLVLQL